MVYIVISVCIFPMLHLVDVWYNVMYCKCTMYGSYGYSIYRLPSIIDFLCRPRDLESFRDLEAPSGTLIFCVRYDCRFVCNSIRVISWGILVWWVKIWSYHISPFSWFCLLECWANLRRIPILFWCKIEQKNLKSNSNELWKKKHPHFISNILSSTIVTT